MYTPWINSVQFLKEKCPSARLVASDFVCTDQLPSVHNYTAFMEYARSVVVRNDDKDSIMLRLGDGDMSSITEIEVRIPCFVFRIYIIEVTGSYLQTATLRF
jgi:hypothetical protein